MKTSSLKYIWKFKNQSTDQKKIQENTNQRLIQQLNQQFENSSRESKEDMDIFPKKIHLAAAMETQQVKEIMRYYHITVTMNKIIIATNARKDVRNWIPLLVGM